MRIIIICLLTFCANFCFAQKEFELFFDFSKEAPNQKSKDELNDFLKVHSNLEILAISGYCDSIDDNSYNKVLAKRRINSVLELLKENSILIKENTAINVIGEDFKQSKNQIENRKVVIKYSEKEKLIAPNIISKEIEVDAAPIDEDKIEIERTALLDKFDNAKAGDRIAIYNINFRFNSENILPESEPLLEELLFIMERNPKMVIKIHGHICCNPNPYNTKLSFRRALKLFNYLKDNGISQNRLAYNGVGSNNPIYPIPEKTELERIINRRVEIEIIRK
ncbi:OmpA family protein [Flavobacterium sp.]